MSDPLHPDLHGRVALITGASRGIGKAIAIRLATEGADVAVLAKSETSTDRLPGSIHETADAIRTLGRRALPLAVDVRDEAALHDAIERAVQEFGSLDILVNNAGAIWISWKAPSRSWSNKVKNGRSWTPRLWTMSIAPP